jgi:acetylornithine deacetylase/succinyl-diaminopimelate desuccinylase-like protein
MSQTNLKTRFEDLLAGLIELKTVSADPAMHDQVQAGANLAASMLTQAGFTSEVVATDGNPVVFGQRIVSSHVPTVLIYNHLDVQPADPSDWQTDPFKLTIQGDQYFGRGTTDDKGPAVAAYLAAAEAAKMPLNLKFVWELEEEIGSVHFEQFVKTSREKLHADVIMVADTMWVSRDKPAIPTGLRGLVTFEVTLTTGTVDVHSGTAGGAARNPLLELAALITACCNPATGRVLIPGFYDGIDTVPEAEMKQLHESGITGESLKSDLGLKILRAGSDSEIAQRIMTEPTFEVHGITGGYTGPGVKTAIPPAATAKLSTRLVPGQNPVKVEKLIRQFLLHLNPDVEITFEGAASPFYQDPTGYYSQAAADSFEHAFGTRPIFIREGGSIGAVLTLNQYVGVPVVLTGLSLPDQGYHAPNEHFDWPQAEGGIKMFLDYFERVSKHTHD